MNLWNSFTRPRTPAKHHWNDSRWRACPVSCSLPRQGIAGFEARHKASLPRSPSQEGLAAPPSNRLPRRTPRRRLIPCPAPSPRTRYTLAGLLPVSGTWLKVVGRTVDLRCVLTATYKNKSSLRRILLGIFLFSFFKVGRGKIRGLYMTHEIRV